jgi:hypothetical protein
MSDKRPTERTSHLIWKAQPFGGKAITRCVRRYADTSGMPDGVPIQYGSR